MKTFTQHLITALIVLGIYLLIVVADFYVKKNTHFSIVYMIIGGLAATQYDNIKNWLFNK